MKKVKFDVLTRNVAKDVVKGFSRISEFKIQSINWSFNGKALERWLVMWLDEDNDEHTTELFVYKEA